MSDEEEDDGVFTRHIPKWRSDILSDYIKEVDIRQTADKSAARRAARIDGAPSERTAPNEEELLPYIKANVLEEEEDDD